MQIFFQLISEKKTLFCALRAQDNKPNIAGSDIKFDINQQRWPAELSLEEIEQCCLNSVPD